MSYWRNFVGAGKGLVIFTKTSCKYCVRAKDLLGTIKADFTSHDTTGWTAEQRDTLKRESGHSTFPNIWIEDMKIGGFDSLNEMYTSRTLFSVMRQANVNFEEPQ